MSAHYFIIYILKIAVTCSRYTTIQNNIDIYNNSYIVQGFHKSFIKKSNA
jgi:hypothetical protein